MGDFQLVDARRSQARLRLALSSVSGGGKTMGALRLAKGMLQYMIDHQMIEGDFEHPYRRIAVIDTERRSSQLYAHVVPFRTIEFEPPYSVDRYKQAIDACERAGVLICIIDQISHAWAGPGGQLEWVDALKATAKNAMSPWTRVTPVQQEFYDRLLRSNMHLIVTMRAKAEWVINEVADSQGRIKRVPVKIGLQPVQREGIEYEFTTALDIELETHLATSTKDRTQLFDGRTTALDESTGVKLMEWLNSGEAIVEPPAPSAPQPSAPEPPPDSDPDTTQDIGQEPSADQIKVRAKLPALILALAISDEAKRIAYDYVVAMEGCDNLEDLAEVFKKAQMVTRRSKCKPLVDWITQTKDKRKTELLAKDPAMRV